MSPTMSPTMSQVEATSPAADAHSEPRPPTKPSRMEVLAALHAVYDENDALSLATAGGTISPWVLGAYFAHDGNDLYVFLEQSGRSLQNIQQDARVAFVISKNDANKDFVQAQARAEILPANDENFVRALLEKKMPWFKTYTPVVPVRLVPLEVSVSSLARGWFPAQKVVFEKNSHA